MLQINVTQHISLEADMLNRLRQQEDIQTGKISGNVVNVNSGAVLATYEGIIPIVRGYKQQVYDYHTKCAVKRQTLNARRFVPPLNEVRMSKAEYVCPLSSVKYTQNASYPYRYTLNGDNFGCVPFSNMAMGDFRPSTSLTFTEVDPKEASYLLQRAYSKMSSAEYEFGVTVGEVAETAALIAGPLRGIAKISSGALSGISRIWNTGFGTTLLVAKNATARQLKVIRSSTKAHPINSSLRIVDESANHWLAYKFGVCPLIEDVGKILDFKEKGVTQLTGLRVAKVKGRASDVVSSETVRGLWFSYFRYDCTMYRRIIDRHYCGLYWRNRINAPLLNFMETVGFAPWQLPSLAYELVPLSFVVDRFIDIKSFVRGNIGSLSKDTFGNYCTRKITSVYVPTIENLQWDWGAVKVNSDLSAQATVSMMARIVNLERPNFPVVNPKWQEQLVADATNLSLIWGRLRTNVGKMF